MNSMYPLRFEPILRRYLWGGRRLETLGKRLADGNDYAESWEVVDRADDQSVVLAGPLAGRSLRQLLQDHGAELLGRHHGPARFPLLFKFLDAQQRLSIQVHPDDARAAKLDPPDLGKTEAWVILAAEPGSYLYAGLRRGIDRELLRREIARQTVELCCQRIEPKVGDCFYLPAGVLHALGPGLLVAEIQQASDVTYRLYDYNRLGPDGKPRALHLEAGLEAVDYDYGPLQAQRAEPTGVTGIERLVTGSHFQLDRWRLKEPHTAGGDDRCHLLAVLEGELRIQGDPMEQPLVRGGVALVPAACGSFRVQATPGTVVLDAYLP